MRNLLLIPALLLSLFSMPLSAADAFQPYDTERFETAREAGVPIVVHVHASWCSVCRLQVGVLDAFFSANDMGAVTAFRVNYDHQRDFLSRYDVRRQANILVFRDGQEIVRVDYSADAARIHAALEMAHP